MTAPDLSVVIPLYNEEESVERLQAEVAAALGDRNYELILVDDGSTDQTAKRVSTGGNVRLLQLEKNTGQSAAMYVGMRAARGPVIALLDGDLQNDPAEIPLLVAELDKGFDLVCGYRQKRQDNFKKRISSRVANFVRSRMTGDGVRDTGCSLKALRRECVDALVPFRGMHRFIPALVKGAGYKITEVPVNHRPREAGVSKYGFGSRAVKATQDLFGVMWLLSRQLHYRVREVDKS